MLARIATSKLLFWLTYAYFRILNLVVDKIKGYKAIPSPAKSLREARERVRDLIYKRDEIKIGQFRIKKEWMRSIYYIESKLNAGQTPQTDCDEFAMYAAWLLKGVEGVSNIRIMTIRWGYPNGRVLGHNTCVFNYRQLGGGTGLGTLCNWGLKRPWTGPREIANYFASQMGGTALAYAECTDKLEFICYERLC